MKTAEQHDAIDVAAAERVLAGHLEGLGGRSRSNQEGNRGRIRQFIADLCHTGDGQAGRLVLTESRLLQWMIRVSSGRTVGTACYRLGIVSRYLQALFRAGLVATDFLGEFKARHGNRGWEHLVPALQSSDPKAALAKLQTAPCCPGPLEEYVRFYVELQQSLGKGYGQQLHILLRLDRFLRAEAVPSCQALTPELMERWMGTLTGNAATRTDRVRTARRFFEHLRSQGVITKNPVPPALLCEIKLPVNSFKPFIFTKEQIEAILAASQQLRPTSYCPLRAQTCHSMLVLLYALGLRHGEVRRLRIRDIDFRCDTLFVDQTKFYKSRYVPFGPKVSECLRQFLAVRRTVLQPLQEGDPLFVTLWRAPVSDGLLQPTFRSILRTLGITGNQGQRPPRVHDLRHTFAVHRLLRWYREGVDVQSRLPALSTFMGHVAPKCTAVYLTATAELLREANARFHRHFGCVFDEEGQR